MNTKDADYSCTMVPPKKTELKSQTVTLKGRRILLPTPWIVVLEDGSKYVESETVNGVTKYQSLNSFLEREDKFMVIENVSL